MDVDWPTRDLLSHRVAATPDRTALVDATTGESRTYRAFNERVGRLTTALSAHTAPDADRIALLLDTRVTVPEVVFAAMRLGLSIVPLNVRLTPAELGPQLARTGPGTLVCAADTERQAIDAVAETTASDGKPITSGISLVSIDDPDADAVTKLAGTGDVQPARLTGDEEAVVMFTSGTTGEPKGVRLTVGNLVASATASAFRLGVAPGDRWLCCLPTCHMGGLAPVYRTALYGTTLVVQPDFDAEATAAALADHDVTGVSLVPTMLSRMLDTGWTPPDHLATVLLGGAPAPEPLLRECRERDVPVYPTYGTTETASQIATATPDQAAAHEGTVGQPLISTNVSIVNEGGDRCEAGERGEIVVSGPTVTPGYLDAGRTDAAFGERGFHTGDVGYCDSEGRLWVLNRRDDRIITGGENVDPGEVVAALRAHPGVASAAVVGLPDEEYGERVAALIVPADGDLTAATLEAHCRERLAGFKIPRTIEFAETLPRTVSGTVDRAAVRERLR